MRRAAVLHAVPRTAELIEGGRRGVEDLRRATGIGRELSDLRENGAAGTPREVAQRLAAYRDAGASRCYLQILDIEDIDHVALIAAEVMALLDGSRMQEESFDD